MVKTQKAKLVLNPDFAYLFAIFDVKNGVFDLFDRDDNGILYGPIDAVGPCEGAYIGLPCFEVGTNSNKYQKHTRNPDLGPISILGFLQYVYQNLVNGLDLDRFCAPEHIIQKSNSSIF